MQEKSFRELFVASWLYEQPQQIFPMNPYEVLLRAIYDLKQHGFKPVNIDANLWKMEIKNSHYYWYETNKEPVVIAEIIEKPQSVMVNAVGKKNPGNPPYVTDLYDDILKDRGSSITLQSDDMLTDGGFSIWKRMFKNGRKISIYDKSKPGVSFKPINSVEELQSYFGSDKQFRDFRYVLSEGRDAFLEILVLFISRRTTELTGLDKYL